MKKAEYVTALRELADFVESRTFPGTIASYIGNGDVFETPRLAVSAHNAADFGALCAAVGEFTKEFTDWSATARRILPSQATIIIYTSRDTVCKKKLVGTKVVPAEPERITEAVAEHEEPVYEFECPESFVALAKQPEEIA